MVRQPAVWIRSTRYQETEKLLTNEKPTKS